jgi:hypothetical protein
VRSREWRYIPYNAKDEIYFGCDTVVREEWSYIRERRRRQNNDEPGSTEAEDEGFVAVLGPEPTGPGAAWRGVVRLFSFSRWMGRNQTSSRRQEAPGEEGQDRPDRPPADLTGIALSGGGIRSASFCLGILQALSYAGWLKKLDYLSTVSGGGYIGGSLAWLLHKKWKDADGREIPYGLERRNFPYGSYPMVGMSDESWRASAADGKPAKDWNVYKGRMLRHLRQHARYLTPGNGINMMSLLAVALRNSLFSIFVYGGLLVLLFVVAGPFLFGPAMDWSPYRYFNGHIPWPGPKVNAAYGIAAILGLVFLALAAFYAFLTLFPKTISTGYAWRYWFERWTGRLLLGLGIVVVLGAVPGVYDQINEWGQSASTSSSFKISGEANTKGEISFVGKLQQPEVVKTAGGTPTLGNKLAGAFGALSTLLGAVSAALAFFRGGKPNKKLPTRLLVAVGSVALIFGLLILAYHCAAWLSLPSQTTVRSGLLWHVPLEGARIRNDGLIFGFGVLLVLLLRFPNLNYLSVHRYYRDRLMETFTPNVPDALDVNGTVSGASKTADRTPLFEMAQEGSDAVDPGPYPIINANIVLVSSQIPKFRGRGGDNFILTPKHCGSNATGWCDTKDSPYAKMTLPTAIAISGAALNSNTGCGGEGVTRGSWLSFLMGFFNIRLGYWAENPTPPAERVERIAQNLERLLQHPPEDEMAGSHRWSIDSVMHTLYCWVRRPLNWLEVRLQRLLNSPVFCGPNAPNALYPGLSELYLRKNLNENSRMVQLSDGGHFENLGLYELIRRRLRLIIVCDGAADPDFGFDDLGNAMEKVRADFGTLIDIDCADAETLTPTGEGKSDTAKRLSYAKKGYLRAKIIYNDREQGTLLYLTTSFFKDLLADLYAYRKTHDEFPDQPTSDQFFDEKQFEAYRELGYQTAYHMMCDKEVVSHPDVRDTLGAPEVSCPPEAGRERTGGEPHGMAGV